MMPGDYLELGGLHLNDATEAQIRYMAVDDERRSLGVGRALVEELEKLALSHGAGHIVLNARDDVVEFYRRLGYSVTGPGPTLFGSIRHSQMLKELNP